MSGFYSVPQISGYGGLLTVRNALNLNPRSIYMGMVRVKFIRRPHKDVVWSFVGRMPDKHPLPPVISAVSFPISSHYISSSSWVSSNGDKRQEKLYKILRHCSTSLEASNGGFLHGWPGRCLLGYQYRHLLRLPGKQALGDRNLVRIEETLQRNLEA
ncbi:hypothetical protein AVEN_47490-1 [Araneus ventricosus]|uniref:Uncharacterized protein n=1 Tax=Araneus ventricosus TaxID=182803 RepID=A0A4Y2JJ27_ARAVE|nr:hypothetical protein AVEN_47490-1 [Araneus ventricosus]